MRRIAVIGTGISGLTAAHLLAPENELVVYEARARIGGHNHTVRVQIDDETWWVDTGFIVYNERAYPGFCRLLDRLGVETQRSSMTFSVRCERTGLEWGGRNLRALFAQPRNLLRPSFLRMVRDVLRFGREASSLLGEDGPEMGLEEYLRREGYSDAFLRHYLHPMATAIWSGDPQQMLSFPARYLVRFFENHGILDIRQAPQWSVIRGGSRNYLDPLVRPFRDDIRLSSPVTEVRRDHSGVAVRTVRGDTQTFDDVVIATHSDQALAALADPTEAEREVLGAIPYQPNDVVLHTDRRMLPRARRAWSSWNYHLLPEPGDRATVTYHMNELQSLRSPEPFLVTLNREEEIDPGRVLLRQILEHPVYTPETVSAQARIPEINGRDRIWYCGAWCGYGFHEDGVQSALEVCRGFGREL